MKKRKEEKVEFTYIKINRASFMHGNHVVMDDEKEFHKVCDPDAGIFVDKLGNMYQIMEVVTVIYEKPE